jgi:hypothetical protein
MMENLGKGPKIRRERLPDELWMRLTAPACDLPPMLVIGHAYSATVSSETMLPGLKIDKFTVWRGQEPPFDLKAYNGSATFSYTPTGDVGGVAEMKIKAFASGSEGYDSPVASYDYALTDIIEPVTSITSPKNGDFISPSGAVVTLDIPTYYLGQILQSVQVQVAADNAFANIIWDSGTLNAAQTISVGTLGKETPYYIRARSYGSVSGWGEWSDYAGVQTQSVSVGDVVSVGTPGSGFVWTVPETGLYLLELAGPGGCGMYAGGRLTIFNVSGTTSVPGGAGGLCRHQVRLTKGGQLQVVIGAGQATYTETHPGRSDNAYTAADGTSATSMAAYGLNANAGTGAAFRLHNAISYDDGGPTNSDYGWERNGVSGSAKGGNIWNATGEGGAAGPAPTADTDTVICTGSPKFCVGPSRGGDGWFTYTYLGS